MEESASNGTHSDRPTDDEGIHAPSGNGDAPEAVEESAAEAVEESAPEAADESFEPAAADVSAEAPGRDLPDVSAEAPGRDLPDVSAEAPGRDLPDVSAETPEAEPESSPEPVIEPTSEPGVEAVDEPPAASIPEPASESAAEPAAPESAAEPAAPEPVASAPEPEPDVPIVAEVPAIEIPAAEEAAVEEPAAEEPAAAEEAAVEGPAADAPEEPAAEAGPEPEPEVDSPATESPAAEVSESVVSEPVPAAVPAAAAEPTPELAAAVEEAFEGVSEEEIDELPEWVPGEWFVVHTYAGYENKVKTNLETRVHSMNMEDKIYEVVIPMEDVMEIKSGKKQVVQRKVFPGYLLVRMDLDDDSWYVVRNTPGVTGFVGSGTKPIPLSEKEVDRILQRKGVEEKPKPKIEFSPGDGVRVVSGPFANFQGVISEIDTDRSKLKVLVNIFGRETPVELGFDQVAKL